MLQYGCVHCARQTITYWVIASRVEPVRKPLPPVLTTRGVSSGLGPVEGYRELQVFKTGQYPSWSIRPPKEIQRALDEENVELYRKGLACMSQSYGIGALGYFRRVVENAVGDLLDLVEESAKADGDDDSVRAITEARKQKNAEQKLKLASEAVPPSLRPGRVNPLATLYGDFSRGIHGLSDEQCLEIATDLRETLEYVFGNLRDRLEQAKAYRTKITKRATGNPNPS